MQRAKTYRELSAPWCGHQHAWAVSSPMLAASPGTLVSMGQRGGDRALAHLKGNPGTNSRAWMWKPAVHER